MGPAPVLRIPSGGVARCCRNAVLKTGDTAKHTRYKVTNKSPVTPGHLDNPDRKFIFEQDPGIS